MPKTWVNPVVETQRLPENNARTRYLSEPEYEKLIKVSRLASWDKLTLLIMLAVTTGARRGTLLGLRWKDVDLDSGRAFCERTKNGEPFVLVLMPDVIQEFHRISTKTNPEDLVFCGRYPIKPMNFNKPWGQALKDAQIEGVVFHSLRHTHASWLAKRGAPLLAIADSLGRTVWLQRRNTNSAICSERRQHLKAVWAHTLVSRSYADEPLGDNKYRKANTK
jgi:integrase